MTAFARLASDAKSSPEVPPNFPHGTPERRRDSSALRSWLLLGAAGAASLALLVVLAPSPALDRSVCVLRRFFHLPCPGCGTTRALLATLRGQWLMAWRLQPLAPLLLAELVAGWVLWGLSSRARSLLRAALSPWLLSHLALFIALWLGRAATGTLPW